MIGLVDRTSPGGWLNGLNLRTHRHHLRLGWRGVREFTGNCRGPDLRTSARTSAVTFRSEAGDADVYAKGSPTCRHLAGIPRLAGVARGTQYG